MNDRFDNALCILLDTMTENGISEWDAIDLVASLLDSVLTPEEIRERTQQDRMLS